MIEIIAEGPIEIEIENPRIDRLDGWDPIVGRVDVIETRRARIDIELPQGHVNLEGYAPSAYGSGGATESIGGFVRRAVDEPNVRLVDDEWSVELAGEWFDWIQQADRYVVERPRMSIAAALSLFRSWDETSDRQLNKALDAVLNEIDDAEVPVRELDDDERDRMRSRLRGLGMYVDIPESYRPEQAA